MSRIEAIDEAIATTSAVRSIAAWGNSSDPDQLATYCQRRAAADGAQVILARHLGADVGTVAPLVERAAYHEVIAESLAARVAAGQATARPDRDAKRRQNLAARRTDAAAARVALARL